MNARRQRKISRSHWAWFLGITLLAIGYVFDPGHLLFQRLDREVHRSKRRFGEAISRRHDLHFLVTFDQTPPIEIVSQAPLLQSGVEAMPGRFGLGRYFDGRGRTFIATESNWADVGNRFTVSLWIKMDESRRNQKIVYAAAHGGEIGLELKDGYLTFHVPRDNPPLAYEFSSYGEFVHIAAVADGIGGYAALYENGREVARHAIQSVTPSYHNVVFSMDRWSHSHTPFLGILDEVAIWKRALSGKEIEELANRNRSLMPGLRLDRQVLAQLHELFSRAIRATYHIADAVNLFMHPGYAINAELPELNLHLPTRDLRFFLNGHAVSSATGYMVREAAKPRPITYYENGVAGEGTLQLYRYPARMERGARLGFVLSSQGPAPVLGLDRVRLVPPEQFGFLGPLFETELARELSLPHISNGLVRLLINGQFRGIYYYEDYDRMGIFAGQGGSLPWSTRHGPDWRSMFREATRPYIARVPIGDSVPMGTLSLLSVYDGLRFRYQRALMNDPFSPLNSRETRFHIRQFRRDLPGLLGTACAEESLAITLRDQLRPAMFLGDNPSPFFIVTNLDIKSLRVPGISVAWRSESPAMICDKTGDVTRPAADSPPVDAYITAIISDGRTTAEKMLRFRIMPEILDIPVMMLYANERVSKRLRVDAMAHYYPTGSVGTDPLRLTASSWSGGGISHRGNTSHWDVKKPFGLRFDEPHRLLNDTDARHILLMSGTRDPTRMRNYLSYELFRSFSTGSSLRVAPDLEWVEVFFNGEYIGMYEMKNRMDEHALGFPRFQLGMANPASIIKVTTQKYPSSRWGDHADAYEEARGILMRNSQGHDAFEMLSEHLDIDNAIDYHLLLNIIEGTDNMSANYILARRPGANQRFEYVAWDMKRTFAGTDRYFVHQLSRHAARTAEFTTRVKERWISVRETSASLENFLRQIDEMELRLSPYMAWEFERWSPEEERTYGDFVEILRTVIKSRLQILEKRYGEKPAAP